MADFDARSYWEGRLGQDWSLTGVGFRRMGRRFNEWAYRRRGERFEAVVVEAGASSGVVQVREPAVRGRCEGGGLPLGERVQVELVTADPVQRTVLFRRA